MKIKIQAAARLTCVCLAYFVATVGVAHAQNGGAKLANKVKKSLDEVVFPAMEARDLDTFFHSFGAILTGKNPSTVQAIESYATSQGVGSPLDFLVDVKLMRVEQGIDSTNENLGVDSTMYIVAGINRRAENFFKTVKQLPIIQDPTAIPESWLDSRDMFWDTHVQKNEFTNYENILKYGQTLLNAIRPRLKKADARHQDEVAQFGLNLEKFQKLRNELTEAETVGRLTRCRRSTKELQTDDSDFESRLIAAMNIAIDTESLLPNLESGQSFSRAELADAGKTATEIREELAELEQEHGKLIEQATLFRGGSHWWLRGRYGRGAMADGMLKTKHALKSEDAMNALYMPRQRPEPDSNFIGSEGEEETQPFYKRRHYYTWELEYRPIVSETTRSKTRSVERNSSRSTNYEQREFFH